jgi:hypothetical protein
MFRGAFPRVARGYGAAIIVAACIVGASNKGHAAVRSTDFIELSQRKITVSTSAVVATRIDRSRAAMATSVRLAPASDAIKGIASTYDPRDPGQAECGAALLPYRRPVHQWRATAHDVGFSSAKRILAAL